MNTTFTRLVGLAALSLGLLVPAAGQAGAIPDPGQPNPRLSSASRLGSCALERVELQLVRCDDLTGAGVPAQAWVPERG